MDHDCGNCDVCRNPPEKFDGTIIVQKALSAIARTNQRVSQHTLIDILRGSYSPEVIDKKYDQIKTFGAGRDIPGRDWQNYLLQMLNLGFFEVAYNENNHLKITEAGQKVLFGKALAPLAVIKYEEPEKKKAGARVKTKQAGILPFEKSENFGFGEKEDRLFEALRVKRKQLADQQAIPAYIVLSDKTLHQLATEKPMTQDALYNINGFSTYKIEKYGKDFLEVIKKFH